jgi:hypothetical protein
MFENLAKKIKAIFTKTVKGKPKRIINESPAFSIKAAQPKKVSSATRRVNYTTKVQRFPLRSQVQKPLPGMPKNTRSQNYQNRLFDRRKQLDEEELKEE